MILTIDLEKTLTQFILIVFSLVFIYVTSWAKHKIEEKFRENAKKLKSTKTKVAKVKSQEVYLCRKALLVTSNRHQRSIVAASFLQTCEEELEKLQNISDTIKCVQLPAFLQDLQRLSSQNFLPKVDTPVPISVPPTNNVDNSEKKLERKGESKPVQLKVMQARACKTHAWEDNNNCDKKLKSRKQRNTSSVEALTEKQPEHCRPFCEGCPPIVSNIDTVYYNVCNEKIKSKGTSFHHKDIIVAERELNTGMIPTKPSVKTASLSSICGKVDSVTLYSIKKSKSWGKICDNSVQEKQERKFRNKKRALKNYSEKIYLDIVGNKPDLELLSPTNISYKNNKPICKINSAEKITKKDFFGSDEYQALAETAVKTKWRNTIHIGEGSSEEIKILGKKVHQVYLHSPNFKSYIFKVPIKLTKNKKIMILKFIVCLSTKYEKKSSLSVCVKKTRNLCSYMTRVKQDVGTIGSTTEIIPLEHKSSTTQIKNYSLYTDSSMSPTNLGTAAINVNESDECTPFVLGDNQMAHMDSALNHVNQLFYGYKRLPYYFSEREVKDVIERVMLKEHVGMGKHFMDCSDANYEYIQELIYYHLTCNRPVLETIQEESEEGLSDGDSERRSNDTRGAQQTVPQETTKTEAKLSLDSLTEHASRLTDDTKTDLNESSTSSDTEDTISLEEDVQKNIETAYSNEVLMVSTHEYKNPHEKQETLICNFDLSSFGDTMSVSIPGYEEVNNCMKRMLTSLSQDLVNSGQEEIDGATDQDHNSEHTCIYCTDSVCDSEIWECNEPNFLTVTEEIMMSSTEIVDEVATEDRTEDDTDSINFEIQIEEDFLNTSNDVALMNSSLFASENVKNYTWCDTLSQFTYVENEFLFRSSNSDGWLTCSQKL